MHHLVGAQEIAKMLGVTRQRVTQLTHEPGFPEPTVKLARGQVWHTEDIQAWAEKREKAQAERAKKRGKK